MSKIVQFLEDITKPLLIALLAGTVTLLIRFEIMSYKVTEMKSWQETGPRFTLIQGQLLQFRVEQLEKKVERLENLHDDR